MAPKATPRPTAGGLTPSSKKATDPMLADTYEQEEWNEVELSTNELAAFEARLVQQQQQQQRDRGGTAAARHVSRVRTPGDRQRPSAPATGGARRSNPLSSAVGALRADLHRAANCGASEEEQAAQIQRKEDVEDVRHLEVRFGGCNDDDDDSDAEAVRRRCKMGLR
ncbi:hypothetical protein LSCM1_03175 [Leishmania martiniquensis]|uniref:Uncharacterized protein n=1 Tax=Leishmania martiniquensis TaxID=1580590 RepID=A0A836KFK6_9TRYP|nr:hypothetical protein LSCM1_03175 [Leishmania martiniquensis]